MKNYIMGFITALSLTVGVSSAYYSSQKVSEMSGYDLKSLIVTALKEAGRDGVFRR